MNFSYTFDGTVDGNPWTPGAVLSGQIQGTTMPNGDTVVIDSFGVVELTRPGIRDFVYASIDDTEFNSFPFGNQPVMSFSGLKNNFRSCPEGFSMPFNDCAFHNSPGGGFLVTLTHPSFPDGFATAADGSGHTLLCNGTGAMQGCRVRDIPMVLDYWSLTVEVPADTCAEPCGRSFPGQNIQLPAGTETEGFNISQIVENEPTPGDNGVDSTVLADGRLLLPPQFRSSSPITILEMDSNLVVTNGTILVTIEPGDFLEDPLPCDAPIPVGADPQQQDIVVWQTTDASDIMEGRALEITSDCGGSSRGRSRGLSFFVVGLHLDCGVDWFVDPKASKKFRRCFADLTHTKFHGLIQAVLGAKHVLPRRKFRKLLALAVVGNIAVHWRHYRFAEKKMTRSINMLEDLTFETSDFNNSGNIEIRAYNVRFMLQKIQNIIANAR